MIYLEVMQDLNHNGTIWKKGAFLVADEIGSEFRAYAKLIEIKALHVMNASEVFNATRKYCRDVCAYKDADVSRPDKIKNCMYRQCIVNKGIIWQ
jgi:hypothetical protein